jgi:hypothetical protein
MSANSSRTSATSTAITRLEMHNSRMMAEEEWPSCWEAVSALTRCETGLSPSCGTSDLVPEGTEAGARRCRGEGERRCDQGRLPDRRHHRRDLRRHRLFVGSFIIGHTFTMTVSQCSREIALLRLRGAAPTAGGGAAQHPEFAPRRAVVSLPAACTRHPAARSSQGDPVGAGCTR